MKINADEFTQKTTWILKDELLKKQFTILEGMQENSQILKIDYQTERNVRKVKKFIFRRKQFVQIHRFSLQTTGQDGRINDFRTLEFEVIDLEAKKGMNWYDPIMISTVIGGLIYLFYYGNN